MAVISGSDVKQRMAALLKQPVERLEDGRVLTDLVAESFLLIEMVIQLQEDLHIRLVQDDLNDVKTVDDLVQVVLVKTKG